MENCCKNSYRICDKFIGCPLELKIKVPENYTEDSVFVKIYKGGVAVEVLVDVAFGYATIDLLDDDFPEGFINGYGSPIYEVFLIDIETNQIIELQPSGSPVTSVIFEVMVGTSSQTQFVITY